MSPLLYEDDNLVVVDKPAGLLSVPGRGVDKKDCLERRLRQQMGSVFTVHRLDEATSGLMVFARTAESQIALQAAFRERRVHKRYQALVEGHMIAQRGWVDLPLITDWYHRPRQMVSAQTEGYPDAGKPQRLHYAKPAWTKWQRLRITALSGQAVSWVELEPVTGRTHQLRVHMASMGHPIWGDDLYGSGVAHTTSPRLCLHAVRLAFEHPFDKTPLLFESPAPFVAQETSQPA